MVMERRDDDEAIWAEVGRQWKIRGDTTYLNHGSFGPSPDDVRQERSEWQQRLDEQPMDFLLRVLEPAWLAARSHLAGFLKTKAETWFFVENATMGMNVVADSFPLNVGDQVLLSNHEYGAVQRIWERACRRAGTDSPRIAHLPRPLESSEEIIEALEAEITDRTRLIVVSHITSATAMKMPVDRITSLARGRGIAVCIDGPHAPLQTDVHLDDIGCDFYTASCHKWLCAPFGSGFLYVDEKSQSRLEPSLLSWGRGPSEVRRDWSDEFL